jgi:hypothetical protein
MSSGDGRLEKIIHADIRADGDKLMSPISKLLAMVASPAVLVTVVVSLTCISSSVPLTTNDRMRYHCPSVRAAVFSVVAPELIRIALAVAECRMAAAVVPLPLTR